MKIRITGTGMVSSIGLNEAETLASLAGKRSGMGSVSLFESVTGKETRVSEVKAGNEELKKLLGIPVSRTASRTALLGMLAARQAYLDAGLDRRFGLRIGFISGTTVGGMDLSENFYAHFLSDRSKGRMRDIVSHDCADSTEKIAGWLGISDYITTISTACSSAANAIMLGARLIRNGLLDCVLAGGTDSLCRFTLNGFSSLKILDPEACRPFDATRAGLNLGEGAGYLVLEKETSGTSGEYCYLSGYGNICEAYHQTASTPEGEGPYRAMAKALETAGLVPEDIDYINLHGTGTPNNDLAEGNAVKKLFGDKLPLVSSTKAFTGHTLGAAGGIEAVLSVWAVKKGMVYPNLNFTAPVPEHGLIPITEFREGLDIKNAMSNSFGFGGNDSALVFSRV